VKIKYEQLDSKLEDIRKQHVYFFEYYMYYLCVKRFHWFSNTKMANQKNSSFDFFPNLVYFCYNFLRGELINTFILFAVQFYRTWYTMYDGNIHTIVLLWLFFFFVNVKLLLKLFWLHLMVKQVQLIDLSTLFLIESMLCVLLN
jgi:hypothetical protein